MKQNNKGFTLIELLAVILILGIIALIAVPTVNAVIEQARKGASETSVKNLVSAVEQNCTSELLEGDDITTLYIFNDNNEIDPVLDIKGSLPNKGIVRVNDSCEVSISATSGNYSIEKGFTSDEYKVENTNEGLSKPEVFKDWSSVEIYIVDNDIDESSKEFYEEIGVDYEYLFDGGKSSMIYLYDTEEKHALLLSTLILGDKKKIESQKLMNEIDKLRNFFKDYGGDYYYEDEQLFYFDGNYYIIIMKGDEEYNIDYQNIDENMEGATKAYTFKD